MKARGVLFGLNYTGTDCALNGCINDVAAMRQFLEKECAIPCEVYTDDVSPDDTTYTGIVARLYELAVATYRDSLDMVWIHYSGHGSFVVDTSGDEADGRDEGIVPTDYQRVGIIIDDVINRILMSFNPRTRVVTVFDSCHSGTVCDMKYIWESPTKARLDNVACAIRAPMISISGCLDVQVSMDAYDPKRRAFQGALTTCLLATLEDKAIRANIFKVHDRLRAVLKERGFEQQSMLSSTYSLFKDPKFL